MAKENAFYFSHDYNARNDRKIAALVRDFKSSGYGIFWCTVEMLHEEGGILELDDITYAAIAKDLNEDVKQIEAVLQACLSKYNLLRCASNVLQSNRVIKNLEERKQNRSKKSEAGRVGGIKSGLSRNSKSKTKQNEAVLQNDEAVLEANEPKERKGKERKINKIHISDSEKFAQFPTPNDLNGLPEIKIGSVIQMVNIMKHIELSNEDVLGMWEVFKIQSLTGKKFYQDKDAVYSHFINWAKDKRFEQNNGKNKMVY